MKYTDGSYDNVLWMMKKLWGKNMRRPYIICHMTTSINGKVTGDFLTTEAGTKACEVYYELNRDFKADGFACGRVTMEGSFTAGWYPDLTQYAPVNHGGAGKLSWMDDNMEGPYAVAFDPHGRLGWQSNRIVDPDGDPGYDGARIIEVLTEQVDERYLGYLEATDIPYIFAGETEIDVPLALLYLRDVVGIETLLLEGGSILNGAFMESDVIDELSLVLCPVVAASDDKPLFQESVMSDYKLAEVRQYDGGVLWLNYKKGI